MESAAQRVAGWGSERGAGTVTTGGGAGSAEREACRWVLPSPPPLPKRTHGVDYCVDERWRQEEVRLARFRGTCERMHHRMRTQRRGRHPSKKTGQMESEIKEEEGEEEEERAERCEVEDVGEENNIGGQGEGGGGCEEVAIKMEGECEWAGCPMESEDVGVVEGADEEGSGAGVLEAEGDAEHSSKKDGKKRAEQGDQQSEERGVKRSEDIPSHALMVAKQCNAHQGTLQDTRNDEPWQGKRGSDKDKGERREEGENGKGEGERPADGGVRHCVEMKKDEGVGECSQTDKGGRAGWEDDGRPSGMVAGGRGEDTDRETKGQAFRTPPKAAAGGLKSPGRGVFSPKREASEHNKLRLEKAIRGHVKESLASSGHRMYDHDMYDSIVEDLVALATSGHRSLLARDVTAEDLVTLSERVCSEHLEAILQDHAGLIEEEDEEP